MDNSQQYDPYSNNSPLERKDSNEVYLKDKLTMLKEKFIYYAIRILPYIGRFITFLFFYLRRIITSGIKIAIEQLKF